MHGEEHHVAWVDLESEAHEEGGLHDECDLHIFRYFLRGSVPFEEALDDESPVSDGSPEVGGLGSDRGVDEFH